MLVIFEVFDDFLFKFGREQLEFFIGIGSSFPSIFFNVSIRISFDVDSERNLSGAISTKSPFSACIWFLREEYISKIILCVYFFRKNIFAKTSEIYEWTRHYFIGARTFPVEYYGADILFRECQVSGSGYDEGRMLFGYYFLYFFRVPFSLMTLERTKG